MSAGQTIRSAGAEADVGRSMAGDGDQRVSIFEIMGDRAVSVECVFRSAASCYVHTCIAIFALGRLADTSITGMPRLKTKRVQPS